MRKTGRRTGKEQTGSRQRYLPLKEFAREALWDTVMVSGLAFVEEALEAERSALCGMRYAHDAERVAQRAGHVVSSLCLGGRRAQVERPRVRSIDGHELALPSWQAWSSRDPLDARALEQVVLGVSSRRYAGSLELVPPELGVHGVSKRSVSERFVAGTAKKLAALTQRKLGGLKLLAVMIDGVHSAEHVVLAAIGIDSHGKKHVLGLREGATENSAACKALLADLIERGLNAERSPLFVIDGAKALHKAVTDTFGSRALVQRCREHKKRNVTDALPERMRAAIRGAMSQGYASGDPKRARQLLENLARGLERNHPGAAAALREGTRRDADHNAACAARKFGAGAVLDQPDRESVQPGARDRAPGAALAGWRNGPALERRRSARSRPQLPQDRRLSIPRKTRCRAARA